MANVVTNVSAGKPNSGGAIWVADVMESASLPDDATTALDTSVWTCLGFVSEDGLSNENSPESDTVKAWGGDTVLTVQTSKEDTFAFTLIEVLNVNVLKFIYGENNVSGTLADGIEITANSDELEAHAIVIELNMRDDAVKRIVIPNAKVSEVGSISYTDSDAVGYETTVSAMPDSLGNTHYEYAKRA